MSKNVGTVGSEQQQMVSCVRELISSSGQSYDDLRERWFQVSSLIHAQLAQAVQPRLSERVITMPQSTYREKQALALWFNAELRYWGLALRCPKTGQPSMLQVNPG